MGKYNRRAPCGIHNQKLGVQCESWQSAPEKEKCTIIHEQLVVTVVMQAFGFATGMCFRRITNSSAGNMKREREREKKEDEYFQVSELLTPNFAGDQLR